MRPLDDPGANPTNEDGGAPANRDKPPLSPLTRKRNGSFWATLRQLLFPKPFRIRQIHWPRRLEMSLRLLTDNVSLAQDSRSEQASESRNDESVAMLAVISDLATGLWRIRRRLEQALAGGETDSVRSLTRYIESACDTLGGHQVEVKDDVGQRYITGMAAKVLAFQPSEDVSEDTIVETIRPAVFYKGVLTQRAEIIVATPRIQEPAQPEDIAPATNDAGESKPVNDSDGSPSPTQEPPVSDAEKGNSDNAPQSIDGSHDKQNE
jgi:hypothetical protein